MPEARQCAQCGAHPTNENAKFCEFCGAELPALEQPRVTHVGPFGDLEARFEALEGHETFDSLMRHTPSSRSVNAGFVGSVLFGGLFLVVSLFVTGVFAQVGGPIAFFPMLFVAVGAWLVFRALSGSADFNKAELERVPALVVDERMEVSGGGKNSSASTTYYATMETRHGHRKEFEVHRRIAGRVTRGDLGLGYFKGRHLLDFRRVPV